MSKYGNAKCHASMSNHGDVSSSLSCTLILYSTQPDPCTKARVWFQMKLWNCLHRQKIWWAKLVLNLQSLRSLSVHHDHWSLLGLTTLVAAFHNSILSVPSMHAASLRDPKFLPWHRNTRQGRTLATLDLFIQSLRWDKSPRHIVASTTLNNCASYMS